MLWFLTEALGSTTANHNRIAASLGLHFAAGGFEGTAKLTKWIRTAICLTTLLPLGTAPGRSRVRSGSS
jgi:hypothetical protein